MTSNQLVFCKLVRARYLRVYIQWSPSNLDAIGPEESVPIREVSLFQSTHMWYIQGEEETVCDVIVTSSIYRKTFC